MYCNIDKIWVLSYVLTMFPTGSFAFGCLDQIVRLVSFKLVLVKPLDREHLNRRLSWGLHIMWNQNRLTNGLYDRGHVIQSLTTMSILVYLSFMGMVQTEINHKQICMSAGIYPDTLEKELKQRCVELVSSSNWS